LKLDRMTLKGGELAHKTVALIGLGRTGVRLAELCKPFHVKLLAHDPFLDADVIRSRGATPVTFEDALAEADFVNAMCPLTSETHHLFDASAFARMKSSAFFVTTARGGVHDEDALYDALVQGEIAGAGVDVFMEEPPPRNHPLLSLDNVVATPHIAGITWEATRNIAEATADQWAAIFSGHVPPRAINMDVWPRYSERFHSRFGFLPARPD
jgi:D-3-phosphoglycerate dehydrogenase